MRKCGLLTETSQAGAFGGNISRKMEFPFLPFTRQVTFALWMALSSNFSTLTWRQTGTTHAKTHTKAFAISL